MATVMSPVSGPSASGESAWSLASASAAWPGRRGSSLCVEYREMAGAFLQEAVERLPGRCDDAFEQAIGHYTVVRDRLRAVLAT